MLTVPSRGLSPADSVRMSFRTEISADGLQAALDEIARQPSEVGDADSDNASDGSPYGAGSGKMALFTECVPPRSRVRVRASANGRCTHAMRRMWECGALGGTLICNCVESAPLF